MKISRILAWRVELPLHEPSYKWSALEDGWGGDIVTAAIAHLAHSTPEPFRFTSTDFNSCVTVSTAEGAPRRDNGFMSAGTAPGLGIQPRMEVLGKPVVDVSG